MGVVLRVPAAPAQRRLWAVERDTDSEPLHNINVELRFPRAYPPAVLRAAAADLVQRHEALRTVFVSEDGGLDQCVLAAAGLPSPVAELDLTGADPAAAQAGWLAERDRLAGAPFDLTVAPLLRIAHVRLPGGRDNLAIVLHHIIGDAWSTGVLMKDLHTALAARVAGRAPDWAPVPVQYADFAAWQAGQDDTAEVRTDLDYWRRQLAGIEDLDLTLGRPRPDELSHRGGVLPIVLDAGLTAAIGALARAERSTPFAVLLSGWAAALGRVFGSTDVPVGVSVSGRPLPEVAGTVGLFVDRQVLRVPLTGDPSFRELLRRSRDVVLAAQEHDRAGFGRIVEELNPPRHYGVAPLAQASINLQPPIRAVLADGAEAEHGGQYGNGTVRHDLAIDVADLGTELHGTLEYRHGVIAPSAAERLAGLLVRVLAEGTAEPDRPVGALTGLPAAEVAALHTAQDGGPVPGTALFPELVARWVAETPDALAVDAEDGRLGYAELARRAETVAAGLTAAGVRPDEPVLVAVPRQAALPVAVLGVLHAGAVLVPVDPGAPAGHLAAVAGTVGARFALVAPGAAPAVPDGVTLLPVDLGAPAAACAAVPRRPADAAYVLFTSGSTGRPKGVVVEHRQLAVYLHGVLALLAPCPGEAHLLVQSPTFDSSWTTIGGALASGGVLRIAGRDTARDPGELARLLTGAPIDFLKITPSHLAALLSGMDPELLRPRRALVLGGERERRAAVDRLRGLGWHVVGHYGPTEATVGVLAHPLGADTGAPADTVPLGPSLPGVRSYLLDRQLRPVPPGCRGELYFGGALVTRGYAAAPGQTAAVFLPDPFTADPGARMYRSGDLARLLPDGTFEFLGRVDRQVKVRGNRLEPASIEAVLEELPSVRRAAVLVRGDSLVAYLVPAPGAAPGVAELTGQVAGRLPSYAVPAAFVTVPELPMNTAGKLDESALPRPDLLPGTAAAVEPPAGLAEQRLAEVWRALLGRSEVSAVSRFFELGGDSIRAIELVGRARAAGIPLAVREVFQHQTIRAIAAALAERHGWDGAGAPVAIPPVVFERDGVFAAAGTDRMLPADFAELTPAAPVAAGITAEVSVVELPGLAAAQDAHGTDLVEFGVAALLSIGSPVLVADLAPPHADPAGPGLIGLDPVPADPEQLIAAARTAVRDVRAAREHPTPAGTDERALVLRVLIPPDGARVVSLGGPGVAITGDEIVVQGGGSARIAAAFRALIEHCADRGAVYSAADFADSGLDDTALAGLLDRLGLDGGVR